MIFCYVFLYLKTYFPEIGDLNAVLCTCLSDANHFLYIEIDRRDIGTKVQTRLAEVRINSDNAVHSNLFHTMEISKSNHTFGQVILDWISGPLV